MDERTERRRADHRGGHPPGRESRQARTAGRVRLHRWAGTRSATFTATTPPFGFPKRKVWATLFERGRIDYHAVFAGQLGFGARRIETEADVDDVIATAAPQLQARGRRHGRAGEAAA